MYAKAPSPISSIKFLPTAHLPNFGDKFAKPSPTLAIFEPTPKALAAAPGANIANINPNPFAPVVAHQAPEPSFSKRFPS